MLVAFFLVFGLVASSVSLASTLSMVGGAAQLEGVSDAVDNVTSPMEMPMDMGRRCDPRSKMINCNMSHTQRATAAMGCCGCFLAEMDFLCIDPLESRISGYANLDVTGDSRAPISLLKPPRI